MVILVVKRIGFMIFTMIVVSLILFLLLETELTGDPATRVQRATAVANARLDKSLERRPRAGM